MTRLKLCVSVILSLAAMQTYGRTLTDYVDTRVGTAPSQTVGSAIFGKNTEVLGQTIPAVLLPNGMNFWTPQTRDTELKCVSPYYYEDERLQGFRNSHWLVGGCTQDYGSMTLMPLADRLRCTPESRATRFSHAAEIARPDYYSVYLPDEGIKAEMTGTSRAAIFRFTYDDTGKAYIVINPNSDEGEGFIAIDTVANMVYGYNPVHRIYQGKGERAGFAGHFVVKFKDKITDFGCYEGNSPLPNTLSIGHKKEIGCYVGFDVDAGKELIVKAASSFTDHDGALCNLESEIPVWDFDAVHDNLNYMWNVYLGLVDVESDDKEALKKFYGALYRTSFLPHEINDYDGRYPAFASGYPIKRLPEGETRYYEGFSMWDTYRALHPFINLMFPTMSGEMMQSLVHKYEQGGWLPIFPCWNSYTAAMIGDHCIAAIADAYVKGVRNFDIDKAYEAMRKNAFEFPLQQEYIDGKGRRALASYLKYGYVPLDDTVPDAYHKNEQVSRTLEYCYDDFALAQVAKALGKSLDYRTLMSRALNYSYVFNPTTGYVDGRYADGTFAGDNPFELSKHITEGAPCHYTWYVPHDPYGLMRLMGGKDAYVAKLDSMFTERRYWHGNEPCHQVAYMYNYAGCPWKTTERVRDIMSAEYLDLPGGLSGNDDAGQMSVWYVFAALGFYPVCPASPYYMISGPTFESVTIHLENGKDIVMLAPGVSDKNIYIKSMKHNGKPYTKNYLDHNDLIQGGVWEFEMTDKPSKTWGTAPTDCPPSVL